MTQVLPDTLATRYSLHASGTDEELRIYVPADLEQYRALTAFSYSFEEKPYPKGYVEFRSPVLGIIFFHFDITQSGYENVFFGPNNAPYSPKGIDIECILGGKGGNKNFAVQLQ